MTDLAAVLHHLRPLIALETTSHRSNRPLIDRVREWLSAAGVESHVLVNDTGDKAGLIASIGPARAGGIVLAGHTDTVPVDGQVWRSNPYTLVERDDRLFGRGTADMKGFIAAVLAMVPAFVHARLQVPIHLLLSYDEEIGCLAAPALVEALHERLPPPALAIVGEPSEMQVATAHRGIATYATLVHGRGGHSGLPASGVNAIVAASRCVVWLDELARHIGQRPAGDGCAELATTLNVGTIAGGSAINIIAPACRVEWECRPAPGFAVEELEARFAAYVEEQILPALRRPAPEARIETLRRVLVPPLIPPATPDATALLSTVLAWAGSGTPTTVPFASEAGFLQASGIPTLICGPGSPRQAHQADEFVSAAQLQACVAFLQRLKIWAQQADDERRHSLASPPQVS
jgi:acetylornithine deacetylase (ArgE)